VVLLLSCEDRAVAPIDPILSVFPLHKGVVWTFVESHLDVRGNPLDTLLDSLFIKADTSMYGENWSVIYLYGTDQLIRNDRGGVVVRLMSNDERAHTLFKYPARIGDSYGFPLPAFAGNNPVVMDDDWWFSTVVAVDTLITVPAGTFSCTVYQLSPNPSHYYLLEFISEGTGWVKSEAHNYYYTPKVWLITNSKVLVRISG